LVCTLSAVSSGKKIHQLLQEKRIKSSLPLV